MAEIQQPRRCLESKLPNRCRAIARTIHKDSRLGLRGGSAIKLERGSQRRPLSLGVQLRNVAGLESRCQHFGAGEIKRDRDRPWEEWWDV